jgi:hypothetical protein
LDPRHRSSRSGRHGRATHSFCKGPCPFLLGNDNTYRDTAAWCGQSPKEDACSALKRRDSVPFQGIFAWRRRDVGVDLSGAQCESDKHEAGSIARTSLESTAGPSRSCISCMYSVCDSLSSRAGLSSSANFRISFRFATRRRSSQ